MMQMTLARQALKMLPIHHTDEQNGLARSLWAKQAATKAGCHPSGCHNLLTVRHGRQFYLSRMVEQFVRSACPVRFRAATSPAEPSALLGRYSCNGPRLVVGGFNETQEIHLWSEIENKPKARQWTLESY